MVVRAKYTRISYTKSEFILYAPINNKDLLDNDPLSLKK
jgi:hypothetical protein